MVSKALRITLLEPVIASIDAATAATPATLPFLPGSMLWGALLSWAYQGGRSQAQVWDLFQSARLIVGDGRLVEPKGAQPVLPVPRSLHRPKTGGDWVDWSAPDATRDAGFQQAKEMQIGPGPEVREVRVAKVDSFRTAIHPENLRAADGQFFGLQALSEGQTFVARLEGDDEAVQAVLALAVGERTLGRSRSAEFGRVLIEPADAPDLPGSGDGPARYLWCLSDLAAHDRHGMPSERPDDPEGDYPGFFGDAIDWSRSFVRHRTYSPFNAYWKSRQAQRVVIARGSVIALVRGVAPGHRHFGLYQEQGLGAVLCCSRPPRDIIRAWTAGRMGSHEEPAPLASPSALSALLLSRAQTASRQRGRQEAAERDLPQWLERYAAARRLMGEICGPTPTQWGSVVQLSGSRLREELSQASQSTKEKEVRSWQARFAEGEGGRFVDAILEMLGPANAPGAAEAEERVKRIAHGLRAALVAGGYFDAA